MVRIGSRGGDFIYLRLEIGPEEFASGMTQKCP